MVHRRQQLDALPEASFADAAHIILQHLLNGQTKRCLHDMQLCRHLPSPVTAHLHTP